MPVVALAREGLTCVAILRCDECLEYVGQRYVSDLFEDGKDYVSLTSLDVRCERCKDPPRLLPGTHDVPTGRYV